MEEVSEGEIQTTTIDHHGVVAAICQDLKIAERINSRLLPDSQRKVSPGIAAIAMINRWKLAEQIGHVVDCWQVTPLTIGPNGKQSTVPTVYLLFGNFEKFIFPSSVDSVFALSKDIREWKEKRNTDPAILLNFLKILSQYEASKKPSKLPFLRVNTVLEAEKLWIEGEIRPYFRQFSSTNPEDHPLSRSQLLNLIDTFLNMLDINITRTIAMRKEAKQLIQSRCSEF